MVVLKHFQRWEVIVHHFSMVNSLMRARVILWQLKPQWLIVVYLLSFVFCTSLDLSEGYSRLVAAQWSHYTQSVHNKEFNFLSSIKRGWRGWHVRGSAIIQFKPFNSLKSMIVQSLIQSERVCEFGHRSSPAIINGNPTGFTEQWQK